MTTHTPRIVKTCRECDNEFTVSPQNETRSHYCPTCQQIREYEMNANRDKARRHKAECKGKPEVFKITYSPDPTLNPGAQYDALNVYETARMGYWPPGTVLEHRLMHGREWVKVVGAACKSQQLLCLKKEE